MVSNYCSYAMAACPIIRQWVQSSTGENGGKMGCCPHFPPSVQQLDIQSNNWTHLTWDIMAISSLQAAVILPATCYSQKC